MQASQEGGGWFVWAAGSAGHVPLRVPTAAGFRSPSPPTPSGRAPSPDNRRAKAWQQSQLCVPLSLQTTFQTLSHLVLYEAGRLRFTFGGGAGVYLNCSMLAQRAQGPSLPTKKTTGGVIKGYGILWLLSCSGHFRSFPGHTVATTT